jgi:exodeoxyribonuclease VII large subunit
MCSVEAVEVVTYTVGDLARAVARAVNRAFPEEVWVRGEIRDLSRPASGHVYFTLLDAEADDEPPALLPVTLFESDKVAVNRVLRRSGAVRMTDGVEVRIRGRIGYYPQRGTIQLRMTWIDTEFTLGRLAAERARLVTSLRERGLLEANLRLPLPLVPLRVGLITSVGSAAHADFLHELGTSGYAWQVLECDARVQGLDAAADIRGALNRLDEEEVDVIALVRGGGARTDLAVFDSEEVAVAIAQSTKPVLTGIGHETDVSVADLVARNYKTPTACAGSLVDLVAAFTARIDELGLATQRAVQARLALTSSQLRHQSRRFVRAAVGAGARAGQSLRDAVDRIERATRGKMQRDMAKVDGLHHRIARRGERRAAAAGAEIDRLAVSLRSAARRRLSAATGYLDQVESRVRLADPELLLERGWSITRTQTGLVVVDPDDVGSGDVLRTRVARGEIISVVTDKEETGDG